jgi:5-methylcytosine-specific restriction endonuclease McrA
VTACKKCNTKKGDYTPEEAGMMLRKKPAKPSYAIFLRDHVSDQGEWDQFLNGSGH